MNLNQAKENLSSINTIVDMLLENENHESAHELLKFIETDILTEPNIRSEDPDIEEYKQIASILRANIYRRFATRDIPKVFEKDIANIMSSDFKVFIQDVNAYLDRFKSEEDFARQQKTIINNLLLNKQRLTQESIIADDERKVVPSLGNWIKYFYKKVGGDQLPSRIKIAEFFSKDKNITRLNEDELKRVKNVLTLQEYLRRPTKELMDSLVAFTVDLGHGLLTYFQDGEFLLLSDPDEKNKVLPKADSIVNKNIENPDLNNNSPSLTELMSKQENIKQEVKKEFELKPISSSEIPTKKFETTLDKTQKNTEIKKIEPPETIIALPKEHLQLNSSKQNLQTSKMVIDAGMRPLQNHKSALLSVPQSTPPKTDVGVYGEQNNIKSEFIQKLEEQTQILKSTQQEQKIQSIPKPNASIKTEQNIIQQKSQIQQEQDKNLQKQNKPQFIPTPALNELTNKQQKEKFVDENLHQKVHKVYSDSEESRLAINKQIEIIEAQTVNNWSILIERVLNIFEKPDTYKAIALLKIIAKNNLWKDVLINDKLYSKIIDYALKNNLGQIQTRKKAVMVFVRTLLEGVVGFTQNESARIGAQLISIMEENNSLMKNEDYSTIVYFDLAIEKFFWNDQI